MSLMSSWFPTEAEFLGSLQVSEFPPCNFQTHQLISNKFEERGGGLKSILSSDKFCENDMVR